MMMMVVGDVSSTCVADAEAKRPCCVSEKVCFSIIAATFSDHFIDCLLSICSQTVHRDHLWARRSVTSMGVFLKKFASILFLRLLMTFSLIIVKHL